MMIDRKIQRYVKDVVAFLPARMKNGAEQEISEMITDLVRDYAGDREPDILDARKVIEELGDPEMMALSWLETAEEMKREPSPVKHLGAGAGLDLELPSLEKMNRALSFLMLIITVLAVVCIGFGLIAVGTHLISTMLPVFAGCVLALLSLAGRSVILRQA